MIEEKKLLMQNIAVNFKVSSQS